MTQTTYVGVNRPRYVVRTQDKGRTYYYFRRRHFPIVRLPGEPGSELFTTVYNSALEASTGEQFAALRSNMQQMSPRKVESPLTTAILTWANQGPITYSQANMVAQRFGVSIEHVLRGSQVADNPENEALADQARAAASLRRVPKDCESALATPPPEVSRAAPARHYQPQALR
jgi:hypothetical protein